MIRPRPTIRGPVWPIANSTGSMCYFSSTIQSLLINDHFVDWLDAKDAASDKPFTLTMKALSHALKVPKRDDGTRERVAGCKYLNKVLSHIEPHLNKRELTLNRQGDAHQLYMAIMEALIEEHPDAAKVFRSVLRVTHSCMDCDEHKTNDDPILGINVTYPDDHPVGQPYPFDDLIDSYIRTNDIPRKCDRCNESMTESTTFTELPLTLIIAIFPRIIQGRKAHDRVAVPVRIRMDTYQIYEISSIIDHRGQMGGGHYISKLYVDGSWWLLDDSNICHIDAKNVIDVDNYILTYRLVND